MILVVMCAKSFKNNKQSFVLITNAVDSIGVATVFYFFLNIWFEYPAVLPVTKHGSSFKSEINWRKMGKNNYSLKGRLKFSDKIHLPLSKNQKSKFKVSFFYL